MSVERLKSGSYRYRFQIEGKKISFTFSDKLTKKAAYKIAVEKLSEQKEQDPGSTTINFASAAQYHLNTTMNSLSPSTFKLYGDYKRYIDNHYSWFARKVIVDIDNPILQRIVNEYASGKDEKGNAKGKTRAAKTVKNFYGYILSVINLFCPEKVFHVKLPNIQRDEPYVPTDKDVLRILEYVKSSDNLNRYYIPLVLATLGLRRSEICALDIDDLDGITLSISKAKVKGTDGWIVKNSTKTAASRRTITIPEALADMIREQGFVYQGEPCMLTETLERVQKRLGIPHFTVHALRHFYATTAISLGVPILFVERAGGWTKGSAALSKIYSHTQNSKKVEEMDAITLNHIATILPR